MVICLFSYFLLFIYLFSFSILCSLACFINTGAPHIPTCPGPFRTEYILFLILIHNKHVSTAYHVPSIVFNIMTCNFHHILVTWWLISSFSDTRHQKGRLLSQCHDPKSSWGTSLRPAPYVCTCSFQVSTEQPVPGALSQPGFPPVP